jgi:isopentenyl phosphate kinase
MMVSGLNKPRTTVLKIGGSAITDKHGELKAQMQVINRLADEIRKADVRNLIIVHGGGSFGHPPAEQYEIKDGFKKDSQKVGFAETHYVMTVLNGLFMDALIWHGIPAVSVTSSSCIMTRNGRIKLFEDSPIKKLLEIGFIPVLYGDAVLDTELGFTILSGDQIVSTLATRFKAERIIMGVDVDGLYDNDPKIKRSARIFKHLTLRKLESFHSKLNKPTAHDVTGGMFGKVDELIPAIKQGIPTIFVNATKPNYVYRALKGEKVRGTLIKKE